MFHKIVVAVDGQEGERDATALAHRLADRDATFTTGHIAEGDDVADGLFLLATDQRAELIVVGVHHHRRLWGADHTRATLRHAPCPVAVAPAGYANNGQAEIRAIGVGYHDHDPESDAALTAAQSLAAATGAEVHNTHVVPETNWDTPDSGAGRLAVAARERLTGLEAVVTVVEGDVHKALAALEHEVDLLVLGSHHHGVLRRFVLGDTVTGLTRDLSCPLLVIPHAASRSTPLEA